MKISVKHLGVLEQAEFTLGDLTILCGGNNTGKTYVTYALFGFLSFWREAFVFPIKEGIIQELLAEGVVHIDLSDYVSRAPSILETACKSFVKRLPTVFAASEDRFRKTEFHIQLAGDIIHPLDSYERRVGSTTTERFSITKSEGSQEVVVTLLVEKEKAQIPREVLHHFIGDAFKEIIFGRQVPVPFIASAERTGAAIFRKELNFTRNRLLEEMVQVDKNINPLELLFKVYQDYALPVKKNVEFTRDLESIAKKNSFISERHIEILSDFADIIGGDYSVTSNDELYYIPKKKRLKLSMDESSSAVRSLLDIGFYLRHVAQPGDLLMVDEPELNLHPENQRRMARLFARLVNLGVKVFITTHSDYIVKELNTLIMLHQDKPHLRRIAEREGYRPEELVSPDKIKVYIAEKASIQREGKSRKSPCQTLTPADIDPELGIEVRTFDTTIETMNRIQEEILWAEE